MSLLEVNKITPQSGTTLTLGDTGDTINFGSGVLPNFENLTVTGDLTVDTNSLKVDSANNRVGIGTASPTYALDVENGNTYLAHFVSTGTGAFAQLTTTTHGVTTSDGLIFGIDANGDTYLTNRENATLRFSTNNSEAMRIASNGRIGIGTTSPERLLHLQSAAPEIMMKDSDDNSYNTILSNGGTLSISTSAAGTLKIEPLGASAVQLASATSLGFNIGSGYNYEFDVNGSEVMRINGTTGNIGIGTNSPDSSVHIQRNTTSGSQALYPSIHLENLSTGTSYAFLQMETNNSLTDGGVLAYVDHHEFRTNQYLTFRTGSSTTERMRIDSSGHVGIGTTPSSWGGTFKAIDINSYATFSADSDTAFMTANGYYNGTNWIYKNTNGATRYYQQAGNHIWSKASSGTAGNTITWFEAMRIANSGRVGLNFDTPTGSLHVRTKDSDGADVFIVAQNTTANRLSGFKCLDENGNIGLRMSYDNGGNEAKIINSVNGNLSVYLGGTGAANALDDYEEGTWTPSTGGVESVGTLSSAVGEYTKIGNVVYIRMTFDVATNFVGSTITGLPFTVGGNNTISSFYPASVMTDNSINNQILPNFQITTTNVVFKEDDTNGNAHNPNTTNNIYRVCGFYFVN